MQRKEKEREEVCLILHTSFCFFANPIIIGICSFRWLMMYACTLHVRTRFTNSLILRTALDGKEREGKENNKVSHRISSIISKGLWSKFTVSPATHKVMRNGSGEMKN